MTIGHVGPSLILNLAIVIKLFMISSARMRLFESGGSVGGASTKHTNQAKKNDIHASITLLCLEAIYLIIYIPNLIFFFWQRVLDEWHSVPGDTLYEHFVEISNITYLCAYSVAVAHSMNIFVYLLRIPTFRETLCPFLHFAPASKASDKSHTHENLPTGKVQI